jgi:hypothetical protein
MFWSGACETTPINSHLVARSWLDLISDESKHIVQLQLSTNHIVDRPAEIVPRRIGINEATTFPGFCEKHDNELFYCLEKKAFTASPDQIIALRYRSVCREACAKHQMVGCNMPRAMSESAPDWYGLRTVADAKRCMSLFVEKQGLEEAMAASRSSLASYIVRFALCPTVLVSATIHPLGTFTGKTLLFRPEWLSVSIIPASSGGFAIFSWPKIGAKNSSLFVKSFVKVPDSLKTKALLNLVFESSENHAISPDWWQKLLDFQTCDLVKRYARSISAMGATPAEDTLIAKGDPWVDWKPTQSGYA